MKEKATPFIVLLTDFGTRDGYVAAMKGVALSIYPDLRFIDVTHDVSSFKIESASYILKTVFDYFPEGSIFLTVVDPGVGTDRKGIAVNVGKRYLVGPDNGVFSWILTRFPYEAHELKNKELFLKNVSSTFHGRDIFAPVAAHLARGIPLKDVGPKIDPIIANWVNPVVTPHGFLARVIHVDKFGNVITNILKDYKLSKCSYITLNGDRYPIVKTYGNVPNGAVCALWGSYGHLEISANRENCAKKLQLSIGNDLVIKFI